MQPVEKIVEVPQAQSLEKVVPVEESQLEENLRETTTKATAYKVGSASQWLADSLLEKLFEESDEFERYCKSIANE